MSEGEPMKITVKDLICAASLVAAVLMAWLGAYVPCALFAIAAAQSCTR